MRWMTLAHLHLDRVASAWLIERFIDTDAVIEYLPWDAEPPVDPEVRLFGMPGIELSSHDERGTCFSKLLRSEGIDDPGLTLLERIVATGVSNALGTPAPEGLDDDLRCVGIALDLVGIGFGVTSEDAQHLVGATPMYDALYRLCQSRTLPAETQARMPHKPGDRAAFLRHALSVGV